MNKGAKLMLRSVLVVAFFVMVLYVSLVFAIAPTITEVSAGLNQVNIAEDVGNIVNLSINNSDNGDDANITQVNITLPSGLSFGSLPGNGTSADANNNITETASLLSFLNTTNFLINGTTAESGTFGYFWFNITAATPGDYNITVTTVNTTGPTYINVSVSVNDTTVPAVMAANVSSPTDGNNYSIISTSGGNLLLNVSVADNFRMDSVTFNITKGNGTVNATYRAVNSTFNDYNVTINTTHFVEGNYTIYVQANDTTGNENNTAFIKVIFDRTAPIVNSGNISSPAAGNNYTGNLVLNVSIVDFTTNIDKVIFNITSVAGVQNATITAVINNVTSGDDFNVTINTAGYPDGTYNITVLANDTAGNLNKTATVQVIFGNKVTVFAGNISSPIAGRNYSGVIGTQALLKLNISVADVGPGIQAVLFNITNGTGFFNASYTGIINNVSGDDYNTTLNISHFREGNYTIFIHANDTLNNLNATTFIKIRLDNTPPLLYLANVSGPTPVSGGNYTQNVTFNVSIVDVTSSVSALIVNITNSTGGNNVSTAFIFGYRHNASANNDFNVTINTTAYSDGYYNISFWANDTAGNTNRSNDTLNHYNVTRYNVLFDNTPPSISSFSCTPTNMSESGVGLTTCSCAASDVHSGPPTISFTEKPDTTVAGTFTTTCTVTDKIGLVSTSSFSYTVGATGGSGSGGGGGGGGGGKTIRVSDKKFESDEGYTTKNLKKGDKLSFSVGPEPHSLEFLDITGQNVRIRLRSDPIDAILLVGEEKYFDLADSDDTGGKEFYDVYVKINSISSINRADATIKSVHVEVPPEPQAAPEEVGEPEAVDEPEVVAPEVEEPIGFSRGALIGIIAAVLIIIVVVVIIVVQRKGNKGN